MSMMSSSRRKSSCSQTSAAAAEIRRSWSWRRREGLRENEGEINMDTLEVLSQGLEVPDDELVGLSSQEAYKRLFDAVREELLAFSAANSFSWTIDFLNTLKCNHYSPISFISLGFLVLEFFIMVLSYGFAEATRNSSLPVVEGIIVLLLTVVNLALCTREERLRRTEMMRSTQDLLNSCDECCSWMPSDYIDPCIPSSPSISLVNTFRDNELVNVPSNLLVQGDVIVLGPSHSAPTQVQQLFPSSRGKESLLVLEKGQVFYPLSSTTSSAGNNKGKSVQSSQPYPREKFLVMETPFRSNLSKILSNSVKRPVTILANEMHHITSTIIGKKLLLLILVLSLTVNIIRATMLQSDSGHWSEMILLLQGYAFLPLLPLSFPVLWICLNLYGTSRIKVLFDSFTEKEKTAGKMSLREILSCFCNNLLGDPSSLPRTGNLLQILGSITVWCCIDKEGILSLPNPHAEKVFFLKSRKCNEKQGIGTHRKERKESICTWTSETSKVSSSQDGQESSDDDDDNDEDNDTPDPVLEGVEPGENAYNLFKGHREVLNLSLDPESEFGLRFDDVRWQDHLNSLKPLGLNILLNSCCKSPVRCLRFADHTGMSSLCHNSSPLPSSRRCLCLLGKEIGFRERALQLFRKQQYIFAVQSSANSACQLPIHSHSFLCISKEKPVPYMVSLVVKEQHTGSLQLLTQGSADIVLDACSDFWDGSSLCPLTAFERKKVFDFYQRNSLTSHCVAFAYRPVNEISDFGSSDVYLELPPLIQWFHSEDEDTESTSEFSEDESEGNADEESVFDIMELLDKDLTASSLLDKVNIAEDVENYQRVIGGQIFIGVVTLQFQAKKDMVPLIEDLNNAGIRFVYFSAENELRSRVFAERMGLETGWNCHISLRERSAHQDDHSSTATVSERNAESLIDIQEGQEKHVSWTGIDGGSDAKAVQSKLGTTEVDPLMEGEGDGASTLLGSSQLSGPEDYWFFFNRANLPRGIQNIRPHLENVDNVPLLVPLFTDCSPSAVQEMIAVMQEYGEIVCCVGSSFNCVNPAIFIQADISIAVEPLFPQLCLKGLPKDFRSGTPQLGQENTRDKLHRRCKGNLSTEEEHELSPLELSALLNALPCSLAFHRDVNFEFKDLIKEARRLCFGLRNCFSFMLSCQLSLSSLVLLSSFLLLPPPLTGLHLLWLSCLIVPLLSLSLIGVPAGNDLMTMITAKNDRNFKDMTRTGCLVFMVCFLPSVCVCCLLLFPLTLQGFCKSSHKKSSTSCHYLLGFRNSTELWNGLGESHSQALAMAQDINALFFVVVLVVISSSYVHRLHLLWRKSPFINRLWILSVLLALFLQIFYFALSQASWGRQAMVVFRVTDTPVPSVIILILWPFIALAICELFKRRYIKERIRYQKRAKLKFGTKLGMNSPF